MWISFNEPKVLDYLLSEEEVFTVRHYPAEPPYIRQAKRKSEFLGFSVEIETICKLQKGKLAKTLYPSLTPLGEHYRKSGYESA